MSDPVFVLAHLDGIARGTQLKAFGCSRSAVRAAIRAGRVLQVRQGVFAAQDANPLIVQAADHGGALTGGAALTARGIWTMTNATELHVWMGLGGRVHHLDCSCVSHFTPGRMSLGLAPVDIALVHAYVRHGAEFFFAAFESAWNTRSISAAGRANVRAALPSYARWLVDLARPDAESGLESIVRLRLHLAGIAVRVQVVIDGVGRVDLVIEERIILEADGKGNHEGARQRHRDLHRDAMASLLGYETLRFDYAMILHEWDIVLLAIRAALARARA